MSLERGDDPLAYILRLYVQFLKGLFNFMPTGAFRWEPDNDVSEIVIRAEAPLDMKTVGRRPCLTVVMGPYQYQGLGIDNMMYFQPVTERRVRSDLLSGHLVVYCLAESDLIAQRLGHLVIHGTRTSQRTLESRGGFHQIGRPGMSANSPSPPGGLVTGDPQGLIMVQVNIPFTFQWTWSTEPKAPSQNRSIDMITQEERASDFPYTSHSTLERVELAMSTKPVLVRRLSGGTVNTIQVTDGNDKFQTVITEKSTDELPED